MISGKNVFLTGPGGVGKSYLITHFVQEARKYKTVAVTALTGIAALNLKGSTLHSYTGIGLGKGSLESIVTKIRKKKYLRDRWKNVDILIIDEISMLSPQLFDKLETIGRVVRNNPRPFGGIQLILSGDFLQLPCIDTNDFCFSAEGWDRCIEQTFYLHKIIRQQELHFQDVLNRVRVGNVDDEAVDVLESRTGVELSNEDGILPTVLYSHNAQVDAKNNDELLSLPDNNLYEYEWDIQIYSTVPPAAVDVIRDHCEKWTPAVPNLILGVGAQVMLCANLDIDGGLANGSRGVVVGFSEDKPVVRFLNGRVLTITDFLWEIEENDKKLASVEQIPLKLAWACTLHKSQGQTLDYAILDLTRCFDYGQAYVGLSRVRSIDGLSIIGYNPNKIKAHPKAVEYYEKLLASQDEM